MFDFIAYPLANLLLLLYSVLGQSTVLAITALTILINLIMLPLTLSQQRSARKMQDLQPKIDKLKKKYSNDQERFAQEQMKLFRKEGVNPMGGCLPLLIQFPIWLGLINAIRYCIPSRPLDLLRFSQHIYKWLPGVQGVIPLQSRFLGMDLGQPPTPAVWWSYALPILVFVTYWLQQKLISPSSGSADEKEDTSSQQEMMEQQMKMMRVTMPLMSMLFTLQYATGLSIYFIISSATRIVQYYLIRQHHEQEA